MLLGLIAARAMAVGFELPADSDAATFFRMSWGQPGWIVNLKGSVPKFCANWWSRRMIPSSSGGFSL